MNVSFSPILDKDRELQLSQLWLVWILLQGDTNNLHSLRM